MGKYRKKYTNGGYTDVSSTFQGAEDMISSIPVIGAGRALSEGIAGMFGNGTGGSIAKGFIDPQASTVRGINDIVNGKIGWDTLFDIQLPGIGQMIENRKQAKKPKLNYNGNPALNQITYNPYQATFALGGIVNPMLNDMQVPVELEKEEVFETPNGDMGQVDGPTHAEGGVNINLPQQSFVWSDRLKSKSGRTFADEAAKLAKLKVKYEKILNS